MPDMFQETWGCKWKGVKDAQFCQLMNWDIKFTPIHFPLKNIQYWPIILEWCSHSVSDNSFSTLIFQPTRCFYTCLSVQGGEGCLPQCMLGYHHHHPLGADTSRRRHPHQQTATVADSTYPTGMHSCIIDSVWNSVADPEILSGIGETIMNIFLIFFTEPEGHPVFHPQWIHY